MSVQGQVSVRGRFAPGVVVALVRPVDQANAFRAGGGDRTVDRKRVGPDGAVSFTSDVEPGDVYFVTGYDGGVYHEARVIASAEDAHVVEQHPTGPVVSRTAGGKVLFTPAETGALIDVAAHPELAPVEEPVLESVNENEGVKPDVGGAPAGSGPVVEKPVRKRAKKTSAASAVGKKAAVRSSNSSKEK